jgi:hypothetical protein
MSAELLTCPSCGGDRVVLYEETSYMANSGEHYCHSIKMQDPNAKASCLDCQWSGQHDQLNGYEA